MEKKRQIFLKVLSAALAVMPEAGSDGTGEVISLCGTDEGTIEQILKMAEAHAVLPLLYPILDSAKIEEANRGKLRRQTSIRVAQFYRLLNLSLRYVSLLEKAGIETVILKGVGLSGYYPYPELRKSGDVDILLLKPSQVEAASRILIEEGLVMAEEQDISHHLIFRNSQNITVELHISMHEIVDNQKTNDILNEFHRDLTDARRWMEVVKNARVPVLRDGYQALSMLLHMLNHFTRSGFGIKLFCDWTVFWNKGIDETEKQVYEEMVRKCGLVGFHDMITGSCHKYLGLRQEYYLSEKFDDGQCQEFMNEIMDAEEFGKTSVSRMVTLRGTKVRDYIREFHHQMHMNFPKIGKIWILWPGLWVYTLAKFLNNNRKIRRIRLSSIIRETNRRSRMAKALGLFQKH